MVNQRIVFILRTKVRCLPLFCLQQNKLYVLAYWLAFPYDYCSVTHNRDTDFALPGKKAFVVKSAPYFVPNLPRLSNTDCQLINMMYSCPSRSMCASCKYGKKYSKKTSNK